MTDPAGEEVSEHLELEIVDEKTDQEVASEEELNLTVEVTNTAGEEGEAAIEVDFNEEEKITSKEITVGAEESSEFELSFTVPEDYEDENVPLTAYIPYHSGDGIMITVKENVHFNIEINVSESNEEVRRTDDLTTVAEVTNEGTKEATQTIELDLLDSDNSDSQEITLASGETKELTLTVGIEEDMGLGEHTVIVESSADEDDYSEDSYFVEILRELKSLTISLSDYGMGEVIVNPQADEYAEKVVSSSSQTFEIVRETPIILSAYPVEHYRFSHWKSEKTDFDEQSDSIDFLLDEEDRDIEAVFTPKETILHIGHHGEGGGLKNHTSGEYYEYDRGETIEIEAEEPDYGWRFEGWYSTVGDADHEKYVEDPEALNTTIEMGEEEVFIMAVYSKIMHDLTINISGKGTVEPHIGTEQYQKGTRVTLIPKPDEGNSFKSWEGPDSEDVEVDSIYIDENKEITALFAIETVQLSVSSDDGGTTSPEGDMAVQTNSTVDIVAISDPAYDFVQWKGSDKISDPEAASTYIEIGDDDIGIEAVFEEGEICIEVVVAGPGETEPEPDVYCFGAGDNIQLNAVPNEDAEFIGWTGPVKNNDSRTTYIDIENL